MFRFFFWLSRLQIVYGSLGCLRWKRYFWRSGLLGAWFSSSWSFLTSRLYRDCLDCLAICTNWLSKLSMGLSANLAPLDSLSRLSAWQSTCRIQFLEIHGSIFAVQAFDAAKTPFFIDQTNGNHF